MIDGNNFRLRKIMKVRIVGLGAREDETCCFTGNPATGYIEINHEMIPCNLKLLGPGAIGEMVDVPQMFNERLTHLIRSQVFSDPNYDDLRDHSTI